MTRRRRVYDVDDNQGPIVDGLRAIGASVQLLADVGKGCPDILCGYRGRNWLMEIKNPKRPPSARKLRPDQKEWHLAWGGQVEVVETVEQAIAIVTQSEWNDAKEKQPEVGRVVIVGLKVPHTPPQVNLGYLGDKGWVGLQHVTHWMLLPDLL